MRPRPQITSSARTQKSAGQAPRKRGKAVDMAVAQRRGAQSNRIRAQSFAKRMVPHIEALQNQGLSLRQMVQKLNSRGVPAARGGRWHITTLRKVLSRLLVASLVHMPSQKE